MHSSFSAKSTDARVAALEREVKELQERLGPREDPQVIVSRHIRQLHEYNEAKDATQILVGRLSQLRQTTIKKIHEEYDLIDEE